MNDNWQPSAELRALTGAKVKRGLEQGAFDPAALLIAIRPHIAGDALRTAAAALRPHRSMTGDFAAKCVLEFIPKVGG